MAAFDQTPSDLRPILEELIPREPIFHTASFGSEYGKIMADDYWEVGASGRRYSREFILRMVSEDAPVDAEQAGWKATEHALRRLGSDTWLLTYTLNQCGRLTRRATIWRRAEDGWRILYHQGTVITADEDDKRPV